MAALLMIGAMMRADARDPLILPLWPDLPEPAAPETTEERSRNPERSDRVVQGAIRPNLTISWPKGSGPFPAVVICPGGGYGKVVIGKEGHALAAWFNSIGFAAAVLKYRLPEKPGDLLPIKDGLRAVELLREKASEWNIDPSCVGIVGASAGGHLASSVATHSKGLNRPDFQILLYPVITLGDDSMTHSGSRRKLLGDHPSPEMLRLYSNDLQVRSDTPPAFLVHAADDLVVPLENSLRYEKALRAAGVPVELMVLSTGGHGFGLGIRGGEPTAWPERARAWLAGLTKSAR